MARLFALMPSAGELLAALFLADVIPESAATFAAFVPSAAHLFVASSIAKEFSLVTNFVARHHRFNNASFLAKNNFYCLMRTAQ